jgi:hypothetical protein
MLVILIAFWTLNVSMGVAMFCTVIAVAMFCTVIAVAIFCTVIAVTEPCDQAHQHEHSQPF